VRSTRLRLSCTAALAALVLVACGGSPTATNGVPAAGGGAAPGQAEALYTELAGLTGQQRRDELVRRAEEEGQLSLYTSMTSDVADGVVEAFQDTFDVEVSLYRAGSETVLQRILQEQSANFAGNDVVETNATELAALDREGRLAAYAGERAASRTGPPRGSTCSHRAGTPTSSVRSVARPPRGRTSPTRGSTAGCRWSCPTPTGS
jgi:iron(III) transport system substrate-binding protein